MPPILLLALLALVAWWWLRRANELFFLSVRDGRVLVVRGRIPQGLLNDLHEAVKKPPIRRGSIRAVRTGRGAQLYASGDIDEFVEQRLRNIFQLCPIARLRSADAPARRSVGQLLGIAWLAWIFDRASTGAREEA